MADDRTQSVKGVLAGGGTGVGTGNCALAGVRTGLWTAVVVGSVVRLDVEHGAAAIGILAAPKNTVQA